MTTNVATMSVVIDSVHLPRLSGAVVAVTGAPVGARRGAVLREGVAKKRAKPMSTWVFEDGRLTLQHRGKTIPLGRYATREFAARAAAVYFDKHGGRQ